MSKVKVENLSFSYGNREILRDISLDAGEGEFLSILGSNGVGKSTLFRCILGLLSGYKGRVIIDGDDIKTLSIKELAQRVAYIPQSCSPAFNYSVEDIVLMGTTAGMHALSCPKESEMRLVDGALEKLGIEDLRLRCFHLLSGGEKQLVVIARALAQNARILMLDEPSAALDFGNQMLVMKQIRALADEGYTVIQTTHNPEHAYQFSDKILALKDGKVLVSGAPKDIMKEDIISSLYGIDVKIESLVEDRVRVCIST